MSPTILKTRGLKFKIYRDHQPRHVHVEHKNGETSAKFDLTNINVIANNGFTIGDIKEIQRFIKKHIVELNIAWEAFNDSEEESE